MLRDTMSNLDALKKIDILRVANLLSIDVDKVGGSNYSTNCPFHPDKTPSFIMFRDTNTWKCFGCERGGSTIDLVMERQNFTFSEAVEWLQAQIGEKPETVEIDLKLNDIGNIQHKVAASNDMLNYWSKMLFHVGRDSFFIERGFIKKTIQRLGFGWDGQRYLIPVWLAEPWKSQCIGVRKRASELLSETSFKYIGVKGANKPCMYGRFTTRNKNYMFVFAGELDAAFCYQDGFSAVSLVNGMISFNSFPRNWGYLWFPSVKKIIVVFDRKEAHQAGKLAAEWEQQKGRETAHIIHWPPIDGLSNFDYDDYNDFRLKFSVKDFLEICKEQLGDTLWLSQ
jgi:hypothetical protein